MEFPAHFYEPVTLRVDIPRGLLMAIEAYAERDGLTVDQFVNGLLAGEVLYRRGAEDFMKPFAGRSLDIRCR